MSNDPLGRKSFVKKEPTRLGKENFDTLVGLFAEEAETAVTPLGVYVANSTKRKLKQQVEALFRP